MPSSRILHLSHDALNAKFGRSYAYDHVGRITQALSGAEARNEGTTNLRPYKQTFVYDAFGHLTERPINQVWSGTGGAFSPSVQSYQNNKNTDWQYDANGNLTDSVDVEYTIAAGGEASRVISDIYLGFNPQSSVWGVTSDLQQSYDGQGGVSKKIEATTTHDNELGDETSTATTYLLRSSVLGGKVIAEIDELGQKARGFVYLGDSVLAWQMKDNGVNYVQWEHRDISNASFRLSNQNAVVATNTRKELDPLGTDAGLSDPNAATQEWKRMSLYPGFSTSLASADTQCQWDGVWIPCSIYQSAVNSGYVNNPMRKSQETKKPARATPGLNQFASPAFKKRYGNERWATSGSGVIEFSSRRNEFAGPSVSGQVASQNPAQPIDPRNVPHRRLTDTEMRYLRHYFYGITGQEGCAKFLEEFLSKATELNPSNRLVSDDIQSMFESVASGGGFYSAPGASYNTVGGDITNNTGAIYFSNDPRFYSYGPANRGAEIAFLSGTFHGMAQTAIHELLHHAGFGDHALARTAAFLREEQVSFDKSWEGTLAASRYWNKTLDEHCH